MEQDKRAFFKEELTEQLYSRCWKCHHLLEDDHPPCYRAKCFWSMLANVVQRSVSVPPSSWLWLNSFERCWPEWGLEIAVAKGHVQQWVHQTTLAVKRLCSQCLSNVAKRLACHHRPTPDRIPIANTYCVPKLCYQSVYCCSFLFIY
jgi:hypothetical protein